MHRANRYLGAVLAVGLVLSLAACAEGNLDDKDSANVVLATQGPINIPPVTAQAAPGGGGCIFLVTTASAPMINQAKNSLAQSPFSDIVMEYVEMTYQWVNPTGGEVTEDIQPVAGLIPTNGSQTVSFTPIRLDFVSEEVSGRTAGVTLVFHGHTVDGYAVETQPISGVTLSINSCVTTSLCGDGSITGGEECDDGDIFGGDGCSSGCDIESGWICSGQPSVCTPLIP